MTHSKYKTSASNAVLMGDIVSSTNAPAQQLHTTFNRVVSQQNKAHRTHILSPLTITLGDEFQGILTSLADAVPIIQAIRWGLMKEKIECRFSLGPVTLETPLNKKQAWNMMGPGLSQARAKLNEKRQDNLYRFSVSDHSVLEVALDALGAAITAIERRWTDQQLHDITDLLSGMTANDIARMRNVSAHSVYKVRSSGEFDLYVMQWHAITELLKKIDMPKAGR